MGSSNAPIKLRKPAPELLEELDRLGERAEKNTPENQAAYLAWRNAVWETLYACYLADSSYSDEQLVSDAISDFCSYLSAYDSGKEKLSHYAQSAIRSNIVHSWEKLRKGQNQTESLNFSDADDGEEAERQIASPTADVNHNVYDSGFLTGLTAMVLNFKEVCPGKSGNQRRLEYYRLFFTEKAKHVLDEDCVFPNESDVCRALRCEYLSYFLRGDFSSPGDAHSAFIRRLRDALPKATVEVSGEEVEVKWGSDGWLPLKVPCGFIGTETGKVPAASTLSEPRKQFSEQLRNYYRQQGLEY